MKKILLPILDFIRLISRFHFIEKWLVNFPSNHPFKNWLIRGFTTPRNYSSNDIRDVIRDGLRYKLYLNNYDDYMLYFNVDFEDHNAIYREIKDGMTVFDVGTNMAEILMNMSKRNPNGINYGFEPIPFTFEKAHNNISANNITNIVLSNIALSDKEEMLSVLSMPVNHSGGVRLTKESKNHTVQVRAMSLDSFVIEKNIKNLDFIKIDVEGFEYHVLNGSTATLMRYKPTIFLEVNDKYLQQQGFSAQLIFDFLKKLGYEITAVQRGVIIDNDFIIPNKQFDILCKPKNLA